MNKEFGHFGSRSMVSYIDYWGAGPFKIIVNSRTYCFEDSDRFGPSLLKKNGGPYKRMIGKNNPFLESLGQLEKTRSKS